MDAPSISVIVPVFNEEHEIGTIVPALTDVLEARGGPWEVLVVDNASADGTAARLAPFLADERIRYLRNDANRGKGYSVRRGMLEATGDRRLMCDADCTPSLASLADLEALLAEADVVAGSRNTPEATVTRYQPLHRRMASLGFIMLCRAVMREPLPDIFCGFKLFSAEAANEVFSRALIDGWAFDAEALALARTLGYRVAPCGIAWRNRPASRLSIPRVVVPVLRELLATRRRLPSVTARPAPATPGAAAPDGSAT